MTQIQRGVTWMRKSEIIIKYPRCSKNDWLDIIDLSIYDRFYTTFVSLMSSKYKEVHAAAAEVLGMVLAYMEEKKEVSFIRTSRFFAPTHCLVFLFQLTLETLEETIVKQLTTLTIERNEDRFLTCLQKVQSYYPKLTERCR